MSGRRRQAALAGQQARVDGIDFSLPVNSADSPALMAGFSVDHTQAQRLIGGRELIPIRLPGNRAILVVTVIDYRTTDIGAYVEYSIAFACAHRQAGGGFARTLLSERTSALGQYVWDLPVSSEVSVKGGKGIWGMPKHQASLDFRVNDREMSSQYDLDGRLCMRVTVRRPGGWAVPVRNLGAANYCHFRGMLMKSRVSFSDRAEIAVWPRANARLTLGDSPRMDPLRALEVSERPLFTACLPQSHGILDDHIESWFVPYDGAADEVVRSEGLESVMGLSNDESWLAPPTAAGR